MPDVNSPNASKIPMTTKAISIMAAKPSSIQSWKCGWWMSGGSGTSGIVTQWRYCGVNRKAPAD